MSSDSGISPHEGWGHIRDGLEADAPADGFEHASARATSATPRRAAWEHAVGRQPSAAPRQPRQRHHRAGDHRLTGSTSYRLTSPSISWPRRCAAPPPPGHEHVPRYATSTRTVKPSTTSPSRKPPTSPGHCSIATPHCAPRSTDSANFPTTAPRQPAAVRMSQARRAAESEPQVRFLSRPKPSVTAPDPSTILAVAALVASVLAAALAVLRSQRSTPDSTTDHQSSSKASTRPPRTP